jgi:hypothetical protein
VDGHATYGYDSLDRVVARNDVAFTYHGSDVDPAGASDGTVYTRGPDGALVSAATAAGGVWLVGSDGHGDLTTGVSPDGQHTTASGYGPFGQPATGACQMVCVGAPHPVE